MGRGSGLLCLLIAGSAVAAPPLRVTSSGAFSDVVGPEPLYAPWKTGVAVATDRFGLGAPVGKAVLLFTDAAQGERRRIVLDSMPVAMDVDPFTERAVVIETAETGWRLTLFDATGAPVLRRALDWGPPFASPFRLRLRGDRLYASAGRYASDDSVVNVALRLDLKTGALDAPLGDVSAWEDVSPYGWYALGYANGKGRLISAETGAIFPVPGGPGALAFSQNSGRVARLTLQNPARLLFRETWGQWSAPVALPTGAATLFEASVNDTLLLSTPAKWLPADRDATPDLYAYSRTGVRSLLTGGAARFDSARFLQSSEHVALAADDRLLDLDPATGASLSLLRGATPAGDAMHGAISPDGRVAVFESASPIYGPLPLGAPSRLLLSRDGGVATPLANLPEGRSPLTDLRLSPRGRWLDSSVGGFDLTTGRPATLYTTLSGATEDGDRSFAGRGRFFDDETKILYWSDTDRRFLVRDLATGTVRAIGAANDWARGGSFVGLTSKGHVYTAQLWEGGELTGATEAVVDPVRGTVSKPTLLRIPAGVDQESGLSFADVVASIPGVNGVRIWNMTILRTVDGILHVPCRETYRIVGNGTAVQRFPNQQAVASLDGRWVRMGDDASPSVLRLSTGTTAPLGFGPNPRPVGPFFLRRSGTDLFAVQASGPLR